MNMQQVKSFYKKGTNELKVDGLLLHEEVNNYLIDIYYKYTSKGYKDHQITDILHACIHKTGIQIYFKLKELHANKNN